MVSRIWSRSCGIPNAFNPAIPAKPTSRAANTMKKRMMSRSKMSTTGSIGGQSFCLKVGFGGGFMIARDYMLHYPSDVEQMLTQRYPADVPEWRNWQTRRT